MDSSSGSPKVCFNSTCKQSILVPTQGWLCRTGDFADLCDRCASAFKDGKFCDTYHLNASGWRCCESCGKKIHCGCIVSFHMFVLLDAGGIECLNCAKTEYILTPNPSWPSASTSLHGPSEKIKDVSSKNWRYITGSDPVPWRQAPTLFVHSKSQHDLPLTSYSLGQNKTDDPCERFVSESWRVREPEIIGGRAQTTGIQCDVKHNWSKDDSFRNLSSLQETFMANDQKSEKGRMSGIHVQQLFHPPSVEKQCSNNNNNNGIGTSLEIRTHNAKARGETRAHHQLLPHYWPQFADQEHQQLCGGSNAKITPLFEKVLSVSDAGKMGRLVVPKKHAEAYLPPISEPEGCPLAIQDLKGNQWVLQYRFWPNNNSRIYVLEGMTPCMQSMQLKAGDTVTFGRLDPEGKLIMGYRKASWVSTSHKGNETTNICVSVHEDTKNDSKSRNQDGTWSGVDKISNRAKRKKMCSNTTTHFKLSVTMEQVQGLLQPSLTSSPTSVLIDGVEFEVFQEAPIIGSHSEFSTDNVRSLCSMEVEPTPEHLEQILPMINHENPESSNTMKGLYAVADMADRDRKATKHPRHKNGCTCIICSQSPSGSNHKSTCKHSTPPPPMMQNPSQLLYADIIRYTRMANGNSINDHNSGAGQTSENDPSKEKSSSLSFKSQNIDLNILPEREEESSPVSGSMGITKVVQESTHRYINMQNPSINGITDGYHINHHL